MRHFNEVGFFQRFTASFLKENLIQRQERKYSFLKGQVANEQPLMVLKLFIGGVESLSSGDPFAC